MIPFISSVWGIYCIMFLINVAGAFFGPTSMTYITKLIPGEERKRFNAWSSFTTSGAVFAWTRHIRPLIAYTDIRVSIFINAVSFFICALVIYFLPDVDGEENAGNGRDAITMKMLLRDWARLFILGKRRSILCSYTCCFNLPSCSASRSIPKRLPLLNRCCSSETRITDYSSA